MTAARPVARDEFRLWSTALAVLALLVQTLLVGMLDAGRPAAAAPSAHAIHVHGGARAAGDVPRDAVDCGFCCIGCTAASIGPPQAPAIGPRLAFAIAATRRRNFFPGRRPARPGTELARGPPSRPRSQPIVGKIPIA